MRQPLRQPHPIRTSEIENYEIPPDYLIYKDGDYTVAVGGDTGKEEYKNTNAQTLIEDILADIPNATLQKSVLWFKHGEYLLDGDLAINKPNLAIMGGFSHARADTRGSTVFKLKDGINVTNGIYITGKNCHMQGIHINGNKGGVTACTDTLHYNTRDTTSQNVVVIDAKTNGIMVHGTAHQFVEVASEYPGTGYAWGISGEDFVRLVNCIGSSAPNSAGYMIMDGAALCTLTDCIANHNKYGLVMSASGGDVVKNNHVSGLVSISCSQQGIRLRGAQDNTFEGCMIKDAGDGADDTYASVDLAISGAHNCTGNRFIGCTLITGGAGNRHKWGFSEADANQDWNIYAFNRIVDTQTAATDINGVNSIERDNI